MEFKPLKYIYQPAAVKDADTLLLLHGTGGDEHDLLPLAEHFGKDLNVLSLRGNVTEGGMPRFFKRLGMGVFDEQDLSFRTAEMIDFLKTTALKEGFDSDRIIALGYSNGANIIGSTLILYPDFFSGSVLFRPMQPFKLLPAFESKKQKPVFMTNGDHDPTIRPADTVKYIAALKSAGFTVSDHQLSAGHELTQEDLQLAAGWYHQYRHDAGL